MINSASADHPTFYYDRPVRATNEVLRGRDIVTFSHDWVGDPSCNTHMIRLLARDNRVLWVNSIGCRTPTISRSDTARALRKLRAMFTPIHEVEPNIHVLNPIAAPWYGRFGKTFNRLFLRAQVRRAMRQLCFRRPVNWVFNPSAAVVAGSLGEEQIIYYCADEFTAFTGVDEVHLNNLEKHLLKSSSCVIVTADELYKSKSRFNPHTFLARHGVAYDHFRKTLDPATPVPPEIANLPRPIIGFIGLVADWVDLELLAHTARHFSAGSLVLLGKVATDVSTLQALPNIHFFGRKTYAELPGYAKAFDVALNPFRINTLTLNANPLKVREYLAAGLPVVSTPLPEVIVLGECRIGGTPEAFLREIEAALRNPGPNASRGQAVQRESWEARLESIREYIASLGQTPHPQPKDSENLVAVK